MSDNYSLTTLAHNSIYLDDYQKNNYKKRPLNIYYSVPSDGVNEETGILLLIAGFSAHSNSKVYKKMREQFADKYNLVTIQTDYFGFQYMQNFTHKFKVEKIDFNLLQNSAPRKVVEKIYHDGNLNINEFLDSKLLFKNKISILNEFDESLDYFNDMGVMQALDNILATKIVVDDLIKNNLKFNTNKVLIYGNSHGSYLAYLCNALYRNFYTHILDNSAWLSPKYHINNRILTHTNNNSTLIVKYKYLISTLTNNLKNISIKDMYFNFYNQCKIACYHGCDDELISSSNKFAGIKNINNIDFYLIEKKDLDNEIFFSTTHGLKSNFIKHFDKFYLDYLKDCTVNFKFDSPLTVYFLDKYEVNYQSGLPEFLYK